MPHGPRPPSAPLPGSHPPARPLRASCGGAGELLVAVSSRSEALSLAPVVRALRAEPELDLRVLSLARADQDIAGTLALFGQGADLDLARRATRAELLRARPSRVLIQGASPGAHAVARVARRAGVAVAHLGAGLRPMAESVARSEAQRHRALTRLADQHLAYDERGRQALLAEGVSAGAVQVVGDPGAEALVELHERVRGLGASDLARELGPLLGGVLESWLGRVVLVSARRREALDEVCAAVRTAAARHPDWLFAWPVHGAARVQARVHQRAANVANLVLCESLGAAALAWLLGRCDAVLTDSISLQGQGAALGRPVLVTRATVERTDLAPTGLVRPVGSRALGMLAGLERLLLDPALITSLARATPPTNGGAGALTAAAVLRAARGEALGREVVA